VTLHRLVLPLIAVIALSGQTPAPDTILFNSGERLSGHLVSATGATLVFASEALGNVTVPWSKVKELHTSGSFAVIPQGVEIKKNGDTSSIASGPLTVADQKITAPAAADVSATQNIVDTAAFQHAVTSREGFLHNWRGVVSGGGSLVAATQDSHTFNAAINFIRVSPIEDWLRRRNRTTLDFNTVYGQVKDPKTTPVKTEIFHAAAERDEYFTSSLFGFGEAFFDHNFSQGLDLQQTYAGGIGWTVFHRGNQSLDLKAGVTYVRQQFAIGPSTHIFGSTFQEDYRRTLSHGLLFAEELIVNPAWNDLNAVSAQGSMQLTMPVAKHISFAVGTIDNYLHNPPPGFKRNSFQLNGAVTYTLR
jgi:hypothetical protein